MTPGTKWFDGKLEFMLSQRGKPLLVHDGFTFGIQYIRKDKKYWQCNLSRKYNCKARVTTTESGDIIVTNNEHCHTEIRQHLRKDYKLNRQHHLAQTMIQQHALQMNLNRLSELNRQMLPQQQMQDPGVQASDMMPVNLNMGSQIHNNNGNASLDRDSVNNNDNYNQDEVKNIINNNNNGGGHEEQEANTIVEGKNPKAEDEAEMQERIPQWKQEILRSVAVREDLQ